MKRRINGEEWNTIMKIASRAVDMATQQDLTVERMSVMMDLTAVHAGCCKLDLDGLLSADNFNFAHDVWGIGHYLDRQTGQLRDFTPRFAR